MKQFKSVLVEALLLIALGLGIATAMANSFTTPEQIRAVMSTK